MKLNSVAGVLNPFNEVWCDHKKTESLFCMIRCHKMWYGTTKTPFLRWFRFLPYCSYVTWMYHVWYLHDTLWWMGVAKSRYQFIGSSWGSLSMFTPWFIFNTDNTSTWIKTFLKRIFQSFWPQVQNSYSVEHLSMVVSDNIVGKKQYVLFRQILIPSGKPVYAPIYSLFEIPSNENSFKRFVAKSL